MSQSAATLTIGCLLLGAISTTILSWRHNLRAREGLTKPHLSSIATAAALLLLTFSVLLFVAYGARNGLIGGDRDGGPTTLIFIRSGNYASLASALSSLFGKGKGRWLLWVGACLMLFVWFSEGMSL